MEEKICNLYYKEELIKRLVVRICSNNVNYVEYLYDTSHFCCRTCTMKILIFFSYSRDSRRKLQPLDAIYAILSSNFKEIHVNELERIPLQFNKNIFFILYDEYQKIFMEYTNILEIKECMIVFERPITINTVNFLKYVSNRISNSQLCLIIEKMNENRNLCEHVLFSRFLNFYIEKGFVSKKCDLVVQIINYCVNNIEIKEILEVYEQIAKISNSGK
ncbi:hypothetical protein CWI38_0057p0030 [Hamiltosporidium tvaerminnensis]|uniref:Uncharacterized protein n=3 Tax=Hamiltosporidium TaxID=1176354 RepID=A0A4Q9LDT3_9MICR|nr:hypothetical protein CWI36_0592p0040 [Hamiltosporidium magnivora]TBU20523.1 hypothetical protein CWI38_0057p0030 [Hamiltosporidium tvaerminnensis]